MLINFCLFKKKKRIMNKLTSDNIKQSKIHENSKIFDFKK